MLVLVFGGFLIFFSSCAGAFAGFPNSRSPYPQSLVGGGLIVGAAMFVAGLILGLAWLILTIARAFSAPSASPTFGTSPHEAVVAGDDELHVLWRLRVAIVAVIIFAGGGSSLLLVSRPGYAGTPFGTLLFLSFILGNGPYFYVLARLARGADRVAIAVSLATASLQLIFWAWEVLTRLHVFLLLPLLSPTPVAELLVMAFAWQLGRMQMPEPDDNTLLGVSFGIVGGYLLLLHIVLPYLQFGFRR